MPYRKVSSPSMKCAPMADTLLFLPRFPLAQPCKPATLTNPHLCKPSSTFPRMTAGPASGILDSVQGARAVNGFARKGRNYVQTSSCTDTAGPGRGSPLQFLRRIASDRAQLESGLVVGFSKVSRCEWWTEPLSRLSQEPQRPPHWILCKRSPVGRKLAASSPYQPALSRNTLSPEGSRQGTSLAGPSFAARAHGRRHDL
jgi:hypothetical protein